jgi:predicted RNase H-like HicB family nuclease
MNRTAEEYMALPYTIEIVPDENGFFVRVRELEGCMSVGTTMVEALAMIEDAMREWLHAAIEDGLDIPLPESLRKESYSGKFPLRMPKSLHEKLAKAASLDGISLNQYIVNLLSERNALEEVKRMLQGREDNRNRAAGGGNRRIAHG